MGMTEPERRALKGNTRMTIASPGPHVGDPIAVRIPEAQRISGFSRSELYRRAGRGEIIFLKCGKSTLVDFHSLRAVMASLPRASVGKPG